MIQVTFGQILGSVLVLGVLLSIVQWLMARWISARLEKSIQHEYDKKLEDYKFQQLQRQKAETIACFFARWTKYRGYESTYLNKGQLVDFYEELNQMSLELSLWIKDKQLLSDIMATLQLRSGAKSIRVLVGEIRKLILGVDDGFDSSEIILWPKLEIEQALFNVPPKASGSAKEA